MVDVLDRDRALLDAGAAGDAVPDDVVADRVRHERARLEAGRVGEQVRPLAEELVAEAHDQQLRRELLAGRVGRADVLAAAALGARHRVDHLLPRHVGDRVGAEAHRALVLDREVERLEPAARARAAEPDVDRRRRDVEVLRVRQVGEEADDEQDVRPDEDPLARLGPAALAEDLRDRVRDAATTRPATRSGPVAISAACQSSSVSTISAISPRMRSASPRWLPLNRSGRCTLRIQKADVTPTSTSTTKRSTRNANQPCEPSHGQRLALRDGADQRHHDRREQHEEAPEDERVDEAGAEALEQLLLAEHDDRLVAHPLRHVVEPLHRLAEPDEAGEQERAAAEQRARDAEDDEEREGGDACSRAPATAEAATASRAGSAVAGVTPAAAAPPTPPAPPRAGRRPPRSRRST